MNIVKPMTLDFSSKEVEDLFCTYNKNVVWDKNKKAYRNEDGFTLDFANITEYDLNQYQIIIGVIPYPNGYILFTNDKYNNPSSLSVYKVENNTWQLVLYTQFYPCDITKPIRGEATRNYNGNLIVAWGGKDNIPCLLNIDLCLSEDSPFLSGLDNARELNNSTEISNLYLFPDMNLATIELESVTEGGSILVGAYYFYVAYVIDEYDILPFNSYSKVIKVFNSTYQGFYSLQSSKEDSKIGKSINLHITTLDPRFNKIKLAYLCKSGTSTTTKEIGEFYYEGIELYISHDGSKIESDISIQRLLINSASYKDIADFTQLKQKLLGANVNAKYPEFKYQKYANNIKVNWTTVDTSGNTYQDFNYYSSSKHIYDKTGFMPDEVYALYINWIYKDGSRTPKFHIPGREKLPTSTNAPFRLFECPLSYGDMGTAHRDVTATCADDGGGNRVWVLVDTGTVGAIAKLINSLQCFPYLISGAVFTQYELEVHVNTVSLGELIISHSSLLSMTITPLTVTIRTNESYTGLEPSYTHCDTFELFYQAIYGTDEDILISDYKCATTDDLLIRNAKLFQLYDTSVDDELSYWENSIDVYPTNEEYDVYELSAGVGIPKLDGSGNPISLQGLPVRHHKMPSFASLEITNNPLVLQKVIGLIFTNILIPDELKLDVIGYEISMAKRNDSNTSIIGTSFTLPHCGGIFEGDDFSRYQRRTFRFYDHQLLSNKPNISPTYLKTIYSHSEVIVVGANFDPYLHPQKLGSLGMDTDYNGKATNKITKILPNPRYILADDASFSVVETIPNYSNLHREDFLALTLENDISGTLWKVFNTTDLSVISISSSIHIYIMIHNVSNLVTYIANPYSNFWQQETERLGNHIIGFGTTVTLIEGDTVPITLIPKIVAGDVNYTDISVPSYLNNVFNYEVPIYSSSLFNCRRATLVFAPTVGQIICSYGIAKNLLNPQGYTITESHLNYGLEFNSRNDLKQPSPFGVYIKNLYKYPYRVIRSSIQSLDSKLFAWREFLQMEYFEMNKSKGEIISISSDNTNLYIAQQYALLFTGIKDILNTSGDTAYLGESDIFDRIPIEIMADDTGIIGCSSINGSIQSKVGLIHCDIISKKIYVINQGQAIEITKLGISNWMSDFFNIVPIDNTLLGNGITCIYDEQFERIIISKKGYKLLIGNSFTHSNVEYPYNTLNYIGEFTLTHNQIFHGGLFDLGMKELDIFYDTTTDGFYIVILGGTGEKPELVGVLLTNYAIKDERTISFTVDFGWTSIHEYYPNLLFKNRNGVYAIVNDNIESSYLDNVVFKLNNFNLKGIYQTAFNGLIPNTNLYIPVLHSAYLDIMMNTNPHISKLIESIHWQTEVLDQFNTYLEKIYETLDYLLIRNNRQCSGYLPINAVRDWGDKSTGVIKSDIWNYNNFKDVILDHTLPFWNDVTQEPISTNVNKNLLDFFELSQFICKFVIVRMKYDNLNKSVTSTYMKQRLIYFNSLFINNSNPII